ncbi:hypothetical protein BCR41DRAFT_393339 [Lobosporangium transversale]|uniref:Uncharacterized protein n=1 Tax=Lobosporangium transversale TaxID=64571 RepID=A0A1Y2GY86_9FUNG|nr:hypothetical protein BCR41DRAFT_393339 [Lobosporangium transversale]ORZ26731.1 hypothetical protein BCR41DRAFT_393339 [Lobosporangium transversale]|eukprot:XP_021884494.1 hypothetical protein BCR41DRAFT_393339 [Lobosporangium transversale]
MVAMWVVAIVVAMVDDHGDLHKELRTRTATLKQIMRNELLNGSSSGSITGYQRALSLLEQAQKATTNVEKEISVLIANGDIYDSQVRYSSPAGIVRCPFLMSELLPANYLPKASVRVEPITEAPQSLIEVGHPGRTVPSLGFSLTEYSVISPVASPTYTFSYDTSNIHTYSPLRIFLRLHLVPVQEQSPKALANAVTQRKQGRLNVVKQSKANHVLKKFMNSGIREPCNELSDILQMASQFTQHVPPQMSVSAVHGLHLGAAGIYGVLCAASGAISM